MVIKIGVLSLQGAFKEHIDSLSKLDVECIEVRNQQDLENIDGLILPGGESTTIGKLLISLGMKDIIIKKIKSNLPVWGTCAGMILLAKKINGENSHLGVIDIDVVRNGYGRQLGSFLEKTKVKWLDNKELDLVFIRAPYIERVGENVEVLLELNGKIVAAKEKNIFVTSFHPELTDSTKFHEYFINMIKGAVL